MKIYAIYESSKGRKDIQFVTTDKEYAKQVAYDWSQEFPEFNYTIYELTENCVIYKLTATPTVKFEKES